MSLVFPRDLVLRAKVGDALFWWGPPDEPMRRARVVDIRDGGERLTVNLYGGGVGTIDIAAEKEEP